MRGARVAPHMMRFDSTHSTWLFDADRMRFCRLPRGSDASAAPPPHDWKPYFGLEFAANGAFTVALNAESTRLLRAWREDAEATTELQLDLSEDAAADD